MHTHERLFFGEAKAPKNKPREQKSNRRLYIILGQNYATLPMTNAATPSSSLRTSIFIVTPVFALKAIRTMAATLPPVMVFP